MSNTYRKTNLPVGAIGMKDILRSDNENPEIQTVNYPTGKCSMERIGEGYTWLRTISISLMTEKR